MLEDFHYFHQGYVLNHEFSSAKASSTPAATIQARRAIRVRCSGVSVGVIARKAGTVASGSTRAQLRAAAEAVKRLSERCPRGLGFRDMSYAKPHVEPLLDSVAPRIVQEFGDAACVLALVACDGSGDEQIGMRYCAFALVTAAHIEALLDARVTDIRACYAGVAEAVLAVTSDP